MSRAFSNREVIEKLKTLPEDEPFGRVQDSDETTRKFLEALYDPLKKLFGKTSNSSKANARQIKDIEKIQISQRDRFSEYRERQVSFWESDVKIIRYFDEEAEKRVKVFLESARQLDQNVTELVILRRFVDLATFKLYQRVFPGARVWEDKVEEFWKLVEDSEDSDPQDEQVKQLCNILRRGKREQDFCVELAQKPNIKHDDNTIYGPLFVEHIPNAIWDPKGLVGKDFKESTEKLRQLWNKSDEALTSDATEMAKLLLDYHAGSIVVYSKGDFDRREPGMRNQRETRGAKRKRSDVVNGSTFEFRASNSQSYGPIHKIRPHKTNDTRQSKQRVERHQRDPISGATHSQPLSNVNSIIEIDTQKTPPPNAQLGELNSQQSSFTTTTDRHFGNVRDAQSVQTQVRDIQTQDNTATKSPSRYQPYCAAMRPGSEANISDSDDGAAAEILVNMPNRSSARSDDNQVFVHPDDSSTVSYNNDARESGVFVSGTNMMAYQRYQPSGQPPRSGSTAGDLESTNTLHTEQESCTESTSEAADQIVISRRQSSDTTIYYQGVSIQPHSGNPTAQCAPIGHPSVSDNPVTEAHHNEPHHHDSFAGIDRSFSMDQAINVEANFMAFLETFNMEQAINIEANFMGFSEPFSMDEAINAEANFNWNDENTQEGAPSRTQTIDEILGEANAQLNQPRTLIL